MLSREALEAYRKMTVSERARLTFEATRAAIPYLLAGTPEEVDRKFELIRRENDARNYNMLDAIGRHEERRKAREGNPNAVSETFTESEPNSNGESR